MTARPFESPQSFRRSLEDRLRREAQRRGVPMATLRTKVLMERLLARLFSRADAPWLLKGGYTFELRYRPRARTTKDIDLSVPAARATALSNVVDELRGAAEIDLGDFLVFELGEAQRELQGPPAGGARVPVIVRVAGKVYGQFHLDVGLGDPAFGEPDELDCEDHLRFAGVAPARVRCIPKEQQFAEKIHAYTFPWGDRENTRERDLVDLLALIERGGLDPAKLRDALRQTFDARQRQPVPRDLMPPPANWSRNDSALAAEAGVTPSGLEAAFVVLRTFWAGLEIASS